jgi:hypothetical protein
MFFNLLAVALLVEFLWTGRFRMLYFFTLAALAASFTRTAGNLMYPVLMAIAYVTVRGRFRHYFGCLLIFVLATGLYQWHRYEIFDVRNQTSIPSGKGMQILYSTYLYMGDFGYRLSPDLGPNTKRLLERMREELQPNVRESPLIKRALGDSPPWFMEKYFYAFTPEELIEKISTEPNEEYYWNVVYAVDTNDQFFLDVAKEIARAYPLYIVKYSMRNLWHALFDPGYATTRYNTLGFIKTGGEFMPDSQGWGTHSEDPVTQYGSRAAREMEYFQLKTQPAAIQKFFSVVQIFFLENFHKYVWITAVPIIMAWIGAFSGALCWVVPRKRFCRVLSNNGVDKLMAPIIAASALLLYDDLATAMFSQPLYRYFHMTEPLRLVIAGFGVVFVINALSSFWQTRIVATGMGAGQEKLAGVVSTIQKYDVLNGYFGRHHARWIFLLVGVNMGLFGWWTSSIIANAWGLQPIEIVSASYGQNCRGVVLTPPAENSAQAGNVSSEVRRDVCVFNRCTLLVDNTSWGDPAPGCRKDFSVSYQCRGDQKLRTAYIKAEAAGKSVDLDCYAPLAAIPILSATYGQSCSGVMPKTQSQNWVREGNVTEGVNEACIRGMNATGDRCKFIVDNNRWGDPAQGCGKDFSVSYQCKGDQQPRTVSIKAEAAGKSVDLDCSPPAAIPILSATYGQSCSGFMPKTQSQNWVREGNVTERVNEACIRGMNATGDGCKFIVGNNRWGDPAQGCGKDFSVSYQCKGDQQPRTAYIKAEAAGKSVDLDCLPPAAIPILSATYGQSCSGFMPKTQSQNWVREGNVTERVNEACIRGMNATGDRCKFIVDNNRWGDPAQGCGKDFSVSYQCKGDRLPRISSIAAEAAGKTVELACSAPRQ